MELLATTVVLLALIGGAVYLVTMVRRRRAGADTGIGALRRLYFYPVCFVTLMMTAGGCFSVGMGVLDRLFAGPAVTSSTTDLAWGLAVVIVGLPIWAFHWRAMTRHVASLAAETRSEIRKVYIYVVLGISLTFILIGAFELLQQIFQNSDFNGFPISAVVVWSVVWAYHWRLEAAEGQRTPETLAIRRLYLYGASVVTLTLLAIGAGRILHIVLTEGYVSAFSLPVVVVDGVGFWQPAMRESLAVLIIGGGGWAAHWLRYARGDSNSALRWVYLYGLGVLGGIITTMVAAGWTLHGALAWAFGAPGTESTVDHFDFFPSVIASSAIGIIVWAYHLRMSQAETEAAPSATPTLIARRAYVYIATLVGMGAMAGASFTAFNTALTLITERATALIGGSDLWQEPVATTITLAAIGTTLWITHWRDAQHRDALNEDAGRPAGLPRKIFIFIVLGAGVLAVVGSISAALFVVLRDILDVTLSLDTIRDLRPAIAVALTGAFVLPYHWSTYRAHRLAESEAEVEIRERKSVTVLAAEGSQDLLQALEDALGYPVETLRWADGEAVMPAMTVEELTDLADRIHQLRGDRVLLVPEGTNLRALSYE